MVDFSSEQEPLVVHNDIVIRPAHNPYTAGVMVFGTLVLVFLGVCSYMNGYDMGFIGLAATAVWAYLNYTFLHALHGGYMQSLGADKLVALVQLTAIGCVAALLATSVGIVTNM